MDADELATTIADTAYGYINGSEKPSDKHIHFSMILGQSCGCGDFDVAYTNEKLEHMNKYNLALYDAEIKMASLYTHTVNCATSSTSLQRLWADISTTMQHCV